VQIADFPVRFQLGSPRTRSARTEEADVRQAFSASNVKFLGSGTFGDTWRVDDRVVKLIVNEDFGAERIEREIEASTIDHPNVVHLDEVVEVEVAGERLAGLVFSYVKGRDLASVIVEEGTVPDADLRALAAGLFSGLAAIHGQGVIHRDIKPENIQLRMGAASRPVILDLGLAHIADLTSLTTYPAAIGTRSFMPPEVLRGEHAVRRSDVYAAAVTVVVASTGEHPWLATDETITNRDLIQRVAESTPRFRTGDAEFADAIAAAMNPRAYRRPTAERLAAALAI